MLTGPEDDQLHYCRMFAFLLNMMPSLHQSFYSEDVTIRLNGNVSLQPDTSTLSVGDFYTHYTTGMNASRVFEELPPMWRYLKKSKVRIICLEMYIDHDRVRAKYYSSFSIRLTSLDSG
jgi:hypothetical protein